MFCPLVIVPSFLLGTTTSWPPLAGLGILAAFFVFALARARRFALATEPAYELLVGPRVLRRMHAGVAPAEILRPEVTAIREVRQGLWVDCAKPPRALFVSNAIAGYDDVKRELASWAPITPLRGPRAYLHGRRRIWRQGERDEIAGTALEAAPALASELDLVRRASSEVWRRFPQYAKRARVVRRVVWAYQIVVLVLFLALWLFLRSGRN